MHYVCLTNNIVTDQCQINPFEVFYAEYASQFIEAPNEVTFGWSLLNDQWIAPPAPPAPDIQQQNKSTAQGLLQQTDWTCTVDITNPQYSNPYLMNQDAFLTYRSTVRAIAVNPPTTPAVFPPMPQEVWSNT